MKIWVAFSYDNGYPTVPLGAYSTPEAAMQTWPTHEWTELPPSSFGGKGGWKALHFDGVAFDLICLEVDE